MVIFWLVLALAIIVTNYADVVMKVRVNGNLPVEERFSWWSRSGWKVARKYSELFPDSYLPIISKASFWLLVALFVAFLIGSIWKGN
jgi:hypothetical protein